MAIWKLQLLMSNYMTTTAAWWCSHMRPFCFMWWFSSHSRYGFINLIPTL